MKLQITPARAIYIIKMSVVLSCSWPPSPIAKKSYIFMYQIFWYFALLSAFCLYFPLLYSVYYYRTNEEILLESVCLSCAVAQVIIKMIICRIQQSRFQMVLFEMEEFCERASLKELMVLQRYVDRCKVVYGVFMICCYMASCFIICGPVLLQQPFPTNAKYPFPLDYQPVKSIIYCHQALVGLQASSSMLVDCQIGMLLWFTIARFEILATNLNKVTSKMELNQCIEKYIVLLMNTDSVICAVRYLPLITVLTTSLGVVFCGMTAVSDQPMAVKLQYVIAGTVASMELLMCAWAGDNLITANNMIRTSTYNINWYKLDISTQKIIQQLLFRSQKPIKLRISGVLPELSLQYYSMFLYRSFSYFTALRVIFSKS